MKHLKVTFFFLAVALTLSGCGIFGSSDGESLSMAENAEPTATVNNVQAVPAQTAEAGALGETDDGTTDDAMVDDGSAMPTAVTLPTAPPTPEPTVDRTQPSTYIVKSGDVLGLIAERFDADIAELRRVNNLDGNLIRVGQELTIPALDGSTEVAGSGAAPAPTSGSSAPAPTSAPSSPVSCAGASGYCIQPGDSLLGIANSNNVSVEALRAANPGISGDLIRSGRTLNLPGGNTPAPTSAANPSAPTNPVAPAGTPEPAATVGPRNDAECAARDAGFPFFHAADGLCYANPIGATAVPTAAGTTGSTEECREGFFLWIDNLCYPIPGVTVTATAEPTVPAFVPVTEDYGTAPCRDGYLPLENGRCFPEPGTTPATVVPAGTTPTTPAGNTVACGAPNFFEDATGKCFLLQEGLDKGCSVTDGRPSCP